MEPLQRTTQRFASDADTARKPDTPPPDAALKEKHERLFQRGLKWLGAGIALMAVSFGINFFLYDTELSFATSMYLLTTVGAVCILKGLVDMLGF